MSREKNSQSEKMPEGVYQLDFALSLFAVLLIYFMLMTHASLNQVEARTESKYRTIDPEFVTTPLRTFHTIYPYKDLWILRRNILMQIDTRAFSYAFLGAKNKNKGNPLISVAQGLVTLHLKNSPGVDAQTEYGFKLKIMGEPTEKALLAASLFKQVITLPELDDKNVDLKSIVAKIKQPSVLFVWAQDMPRARQLLQSSRDFSLSTSVHIITKNSLEIARRWKYYRLEKIFR